MPSLDELLAHLDELSSASKQSGDSPAPAVQSDPASIEVHCGETLNFATVHSGIPAVHRLVLRNTSDATVSDLAVSLTITTPVLDQPVATWEGHVAVLDIGDEVVFDAPPLTIDARALVSLDEAAPGQLTVRMTAAEQVLAESHTPLRLLAHNEFFVHVPMAELVAAHILPNHPAIVPVLQSAAEILAATTGDSSLQGYQSGSERAVQIAGAIHEALRALRITYINPPASFENTGQKIRTPGQVIEERFGTCLDLACTYAACLEQAGLHPVICLVQGHAYSGLLTDERLAFRTPTVTARNAALNAQDSGMIVPVETVAMTSGAGNGHDFQSAVEQGRTHWRQDDAFRAVVDVRAARRAGVRPLPMRVQRDGDMAVVVNETVVAQGPVVVQSAQPVPVERRSKADAPPRIRQWKASLLDLSLRNPLLNLPAHRSVLSVLVPAEGIGLLEDILMAGHGLALLSHDGLTELQRSQGMRTVADVDAAVRRTLMAEQRMLHVDATEDGLTRRLRTLRDKARLAEEEGGANVLHLGLGTLHWTDPAKKAPVRSPILLIPVRLRSLGRGKPMELKADEVGGTTHNFVLLERLRQTFNLRVPELEGLDGDASGIDVVRALEGLRRVIAEQQLDMRVDEDAVLGLFQFGKFRMWKDLDEHWERFMQNPVVRHLALSPGEPFTRVVPLPSVTESDPSTVFCPIPCDGTQLEAVLAAAAGASFVLEGPPGTGKSQTITNMIAHALAAGKRVLFVAEKRAALTVVKNRLAAIGLDAFCLDIHGKATTGESLRQQLTSSLERIAVADTASWDKGRQELQKRSHTLTQYTTALHERGPHGLSAWSAHQQLAARGPGPSLRPVSTELTAQHIDALAELLDELPAQLAAAERDTGLAWRWVAQPAHMPLPDARVMQTLCEELRTAVVAATKMGVVGNLQVSEVALRATLGAHAATERLATAQRAALMDLSTSQTQVRTIERLQELAATRAAVSTRFRLSIFSADVEALREQLREALDAFFVLRGGRVRQVLDAVRPHLLEEPSPQQLLADLEAVIAFRQAADRLTAEAVAAFPDALPTGWSALDADAAGATELIQQAVGTVQQARQLVADGLLQQYVIGEQRLSATVAATLRQISQSMSEIRTLLGAPLATHGDPAPEQDILDFVSKNIDAWVHDAQRGLLGLRRWLTAQAGLHRLAEAGFPQVAEEITSGRLTGAELPGAIARGIAEAALQERLATPALALFDGLEHRRHIARFVELARSDTQMLREVIPHRLLRARPFTAGETSGEVGRLRRFELMKKRSTTSVRAMVKQYCRAIAELTPCFLMSPDSVAQFIEPGIIEFDLVIFDEASQVPVPDAIGAIARGRALVVVGDSRQMPPTSFFGAGGASDGEAAPSEEISADVPDDLESILSECVGASLDRLWLSWHYRSQSESLIAFSNAKYYGGRLASFPAPRLDGGMVGVRWRKVEGGVFDRGRTRTNRREAEAVVAEVQSRLRAPVSVKTGPASIGIVTFNIEQAELVTALLEEAALADARLDEALRIDDPELRLFVKNLENVQGDERDVILLCIGFARDAQGHFPMNFGPLNRAGGERRWNVAVTRARRECVLFSSIEPEDITIDRLGAGADGVRHLRAYMEMARDGVHRLGDVAALANHPQDSHRADIARTLRQHGLVVDEDIGLSSFKVDLALSHPDNPGRQLVAVLLDGPLYAARRTVEDREMLPASVLEHLMRWPAASRIWLPEWLTEKDRIVTELQAQVSALHEGQQPPVAPLDAIEGPTGLVSSRKTPAGRVSFRVVDAGAAELEMFVPFAVVEGDLGDASALELDIARGGRRIREAADHVLAQEGPTELGRLGRIIGRRFGLGRVRSERIVSITRCLPAERIRVSTFGEFLWPAGLEPQAWMDYRRTPPGCDRGLDVVCPEEIANAIRDVTKRGLRMTEDDLINSLAEIFSVQRVTSQLRQVFVEHIQSAQRDGVVVKDGDALVMAARDRAAPQSNRSPL